MALTIRPMMGLVHPAQMIAAEGSIRVGPETGGGDCGKGDLAVCLVLVEGRNDDPSIVSQDETAMTGKPSKAIPGLMINTSSSLSPTVIDGSGLNVAGCDGSSSTMDFVTRSEDSDTVAGGSMWKVGVLNEGGDSNSLTRSRLELPALLSEPPAGPVGGVFRVFDCL